MPPAAAAAAAAANQPPAGVRVFPVQRPRGLLSSLLALPFSVVRTSGWLLARTLSTGVSVLMFFGDRVLPPGIMLSARRVARAVNPANPPQRLTPQEQARAFIASLTDRCGT